MGNLLAGMGGGIDPQALSQYLAQTGGLGGGAPTYDQHPYPLHALEEQIHSHSKESAIQDGRVNVAHAKKKRRLD